MTKSIKVLQIESGCLFLNDFQNGSRICLKEVSRHLPQWWRKLEQSLRLDLALALNAKLADDKVDVLWAGSEKVGLPLGLLRPKKPLIVIAHYMSSPMRARLAKATKAVQNWAGIGCISDEAREFFVNYFGVHPDKLFQYESAKHLDSPYCHPNLLNTTGPLMSVGVAHRDYHTLIDALTQLQECEAEIYTSSKFGDQLKQQIKQKLPKWIKIRNWVSEEELLQNYQRTPFVVVPLKATLHSGAGVNAVFEAAAFGKAVIATQTGGMGTFVKHEETGILVPPNDPVALKAAIQKLYSHPELARQMGHAGQTYIRSRFSPQKVNSDTLGFLDKLAKKQNTEYG